jgi:competence protein ComEA
MSFYRTLLATLAAVAIASPVFADDTTTTTGTTGNDTTATQTTATDQGMTGTEAKININTATAKQLMTVKGINSSKARAIVTYRKKHGNFKSLNDLNKVKAFTKMNSTDLKAIQDQLTTS